MESVKTVLITQARTGSTRLPGKVLLKVQGQELLKIHLDRLQQCKLIDQIIVATTISAEDDAIAQLCVSWGIDFSRGMVDDVLDRFYTSTKNIRPDWIVRVTSDCPLIDPRLVDAVVAFAQTNNVDYASNVLLEHFPDGQDVEVMKFSALEKAWKESVLKSDREHVTPFIRNNSSFKGGMLFLSMNFPCVADYSAVRMTVDEAKDFDLIERIVSDLGVDQSWMTYTNYIIDNQLDKINSNIIRNEGMIKSLKND
ncbi:cytidylyltransferase domain-containing protein [Pedobacter gandavensis]|uniref:cytidylyltransferase domain-containing protein n=1 Tax=Pedobacter gandavensis TaxID=2679963 RepID=UPI0019321498|nr:glycosyltransferase family protein [Pedobacter gandavensis]